MTRDTNLRLDQPSDQPKNICVHCVTVHLNTASSVLSNSQVNPYKRPITLRLVTKDNNCRSVLSDAVTVDSAKEFQTQPLLHPLYRLLKVIRRLHQ